MLLPPPPTYRLFVDETIVQSDGEQERTWFALVGCMMTLEQHFRNLHGQFESIKKQFFRHHSEQALVVFHRRHMCCASPKGAFSVLRDERQRSNFYDELLSAIRACNFRLIFEHVEVRGYREREKTDWRAQGYSGCLRHLLTEYCQNLTDLEARGDVMLSSLGWREHTRIRAEYWTLRDHGFGGKLASFFRRRLSKEPKIEDQDKNIAGLQLADLVAAPVVRKLLGGQTGAKYNVEPFAIGVADIAAEKQMPLRKEMK